MYEQSALSNSLFQQMSQSYLKDITRNLNSSQLSVSKRVKMEPLRCIIFPERKEYDKYVIHSTLNCVFFEEAVTLLSSHFSFARKGYEN